MGGRKPSPQFIKTIMANAERLGSKERVSLEAQLEQLRKAVVQYMRAKEKKRGAPSEDQAYIALCDVVGRITSRPKNARR